LGVLFPELGTVFFVDNMRVGLVLLFGIEIDGDCFGGRGDG